MKNKKPAPKKKFRPVFVKKKEKRVYKFNNLFKNGRPSLELIARGNLLKRNQPEGN